LLIGGRSHRKEPYGRLIVPVSTPAVTERRRKDEMTMIGRSGFHGLLRNLRVSPWTRRSLTERLLLNQAERASGSGDKAAKPGARPLSPSASLISRAWEAAVSSRLQNDKEKTG
jgi:hypothetical protein